MSGSKREPAPLLLTPHSSPTHSLPFRLARGCAASWGRRLGCSAAESQHASLPGYPDAGIARCFIPAYGVPIVSAWHAGATRRKAVGWDAAQRNPSTPPFPDTPMLELRVASSQPTAYLFSAWPAGGPVVGP